MKQKITPFLWFDQDAEEAMNFYVEVFSGSPKKSVDSKIIEIDRYEEGMEVPGMPQMLGKVLTGIFELNGQQFMCLDGGPLFDFKQSVSFYIECEDQEEVDYFWEKLSAVPEMDQCGWVQDKFGLPWQIVPRMLGELMTDPDREKVYRVTNAMLKMKKIIISELEEAAKE